MESARSAPAARRILICDELAPAAVDIFRARGFEPEIRLGLAEDALVAAVQGVHALVVRSATKITRRVIEAAGELRVIGRAGVGVDNVDTEAATERGVVVMNTPTGNAVTTAEHAIGLLVSLARMIPEACRTLKGGKWEKKKFEGRELAGKTLGVIGLGNIGRIVADRAKGLRMNVIGFDPVLTADRAAALGIELVPLEAIWERADAITVHTPLNASTQNLVNDAVIAKLKKGVLLVNAARGGIYDEAALLRGLQSGKLGGVALDVFVQEPPPPDHPLVQHDRVVVTPHLGASTKEAQDRVAVEIAQQVAAYLATGAIQNAVNVPSVSTEAAAKLAPYVDLAERLGRFIGQVAEVSPTAIEVECVGEPADLGMKSIAASAISGFLQRYIDLPVNQVSAPHFAADRGIALRELRTERAHGKYASQVILRVYAADGTVKTVEGTLGSDRSTRLSRWGNFDIEAVLGGNTLVVESRDRPGVIGFLGTTLGKAGVNVARVHLALSEPSGALSVWNLDSAVPAEVLAEIRRSPDVKSALALLI